MWAKDLTRVAHWAGANTPQSAIVACGELVEDPYYLTEQEIDESDWIVECRACSSYIQNMADGFIDDDEDDEGEE